MTESSRNGIHPQVQVLPEIAHFLIIVAVVIFPTAIMLNTLFGPM